MRSFHHEELVSQLKFHQILEIRIQKKYVVKQYKYLQQLWFDVLIQKVCARVRWLKFRCMSQDFPGRAQAITFS